MSNLKIRSPADTFLCERIRWAPAKFQDLNLLLYHIQSNLSIGNLHKIDWKLNFVQIAQ